MFFEIYYKNTIINIGHEFVKRDLHLFFYKKKNHINLIQQTLYEEHKLFFNTKTYWTTRRF
jgi:hypothetical protein